MKTKKWMIGFLVILLVMSVFTAGVSSGRSFEPGGVELDLFESGEGSRDDPYMIDDVYQLQLMGIYEDAHYELEDNIEAEETREWYDRRGFEPVGDDDHPFTGSLDGNGYEIRGLYIHRSDTDHVGLFGAIERGSIENLGLVNADITGDERVGGITGSLERGSVENSFVKGEVNGDESVGGLVGENDDGRISKCFTDGEVNGDKSVGGLVGENDEGTVKNSYSTAEARGEEEVGGLIGTNDEGTVENTYAAGAIWGDDDVGGLIGEDEDGRIRNSFWDAETTGQISSDGGTGKSTEEMQSIETYTDTETTGLDQPWDIARGGEWSGEIWYIYDEEDYPRLRGLEEDDDDNGIPGFSFLIFLPAVILALAIYRMKKG